MKITQLKVLNQHADQCLHPTWSKLNQIAYKTGHYIQILELSTQPVNHTFASSYLVNIKQLGFSNLTNKIHGECPSNSQFPEGFWKLSYREMASSLSNPEVAYSLGLGPDITSQLGQLEFSPLINGECFLTVVFRSGYVVLLKKFSDSWKLFYDLSTFWLTYCKKHYQLGIEETVARFKTNFIVWKNKETFLTAQQDGTVVVYKTGFSSEQFFKMEKVIFTKIENPRQIVWRPNYLLISYHSGEVKKFGEKEATIWGCTDYLQVIFVEDKLADQFFLIKRHIILRMVGEEVSSDSIETSQPVIDACFVQNRLFLVTQKGIMAFQDTKWPFDVEKLTFVWKAPGDLYVKFSCFSPNKALCLLACQKTIHSETRLILLDFSDISTLDQNVIKNLDSLYNLKLKLLNMSYVEFKEAFKSPEFPLSYWVHLFYKEEIENYHEDLVSYQIKGLTQFGALLEIQDRLEKLKLGTGKCFICQEVLEPSKDLRKVACRKGHLMPLCCHSLSELHQVQRLCCRVCGAVAKPSQNQFCFFCHSWMELKE